MERILMTTAAMTALAGLLALLLSLARRTIANYGEKRLRINGEKELTVEGGGSLLSALMEHEIFIPSACGGKGSCGYCKVKVLEGGGPLLPTETGYVTPEEAAAGIRLSCQCKVKADLELQIPEELFNVRQQVYTVERIADVTERIKHLTLSLPPGQEIRFKPGQYIQILTPLYGDNGQELYRAYSIASAPSRTNGIELFVGYVPGGVCTTYVHQFLKEKDTLTVVGPFGDFHYHDTDREMILACIGTGLAPILSILRHMRDQGIQRKATLYFSARTAKDLYMMEELKALQEALPQFQLACSLTRPTPECNWAGDVGRVPELLAQRLEDASEMEAYLCGNPELIDAVVTTLKAKGLPEERIYYDKF